MQQTPASVPHSDQLHTTHTVNATWFAYGQSLVLIALFWVVAVMVCEAVAIYNVDVSHHGLYGTRKSVLSSMLFMPPLMGALAFLGAFVVFTLPQIFQAKVADLALRYGRPPERIVLLVFPLTVMIAWYSFDYLVPPNATLLNDHIFEHGLTLERYANMFAIQAPISLFCVCYHHAFLRRARKAWFVLAVLLAVVAVGGIKGYERAKAENHFYRSKAWQQNRR